MDDVSLEAFARTEVAALEAGRSPAQRIEKHFAMRQSCLRKLADLEEAFAQGELDDLGRQAVRAEGRRRLADLSRLTLLFVESLARWSAFVDSAAQAAGRAPPARQFHFDDEGIDIFDTLFTDTAQIARSQLFTQDELPPDDLFFTKLLPAPDPRDVHSKHSDEHRRRAW